jgi:glycosyltransferase involved in cell wall biosynthesis
MHEESADSRGYFPTAEEFGPKGLRVGGARACIIIPAYEAARTLENVAKDIRSALAEARSDEIFIVDDGSTDDTKIIAESLGARVLQQPRNLGKGASLVRGLEEARTLGIDVAMTVDADGQHPAKSIREVFDASEDPKDLVIGVRNLRIEGAPWPNRFSNRISNFFLSRFSRRRLLDTQCGLRRYPVRDTLSLGAQAKGYAFEAEILLRAAAAGLAIVQKEVRVHYPPGSERVTHFDSLRDPIRIIVTVLRTLHELRWDAQRQLRR